MSISLRDYRHAHRTFIDNDYQNLPKFKNWFHVNFRLTPLAKSIVDSSMQSTTLNWSGSSSDIATLGVLVKNVVLPNFKFDVKKHNQYNKKTINISQILYDPVSLDFHDDMASAIRSFWFAYYQYYIQDPSYPGLSTQQVPIELENYYDDRSNIYGIDVSRWGLDTATAANPLGDFNRPAAFFEDIRIYHFSRRPNDPTGAEYQEYVLVNPVITSFQHDTLDYTVAEGTKSAMTLEYETVLYNSGYISDGDIASWDEVRARYFDNRTSPNNTSVTSNTTVPNFVSNVPSNVLKAATISSASRVNTVKTTTGLDTIARAKLNDVIATNLTNMKSGQVSVVVPGLDQAPGLTSLAKLPGGSLAESTSAPTITRGGN